MTYAIGKHERLQMNFYLYCHHCTYFGKLAFQGIRPETRKYVWKCLCGEEILTPRNTRAAAKDRAAARATA